MVALQTLHLEIFASLGERCAQQISQFQALWGLPFFPLVERPDLNALSEFVLPCNKMTVSYIHFAKFD